MKIAVIDGQGGRLGQRLVESLRERCPAAEILAVGTNTAATERMLKAGAERAATGERAVIYACRRADVITGPLGIAIADSLMGEISPAMANAVACSLAYRVLLPMNLCDTYVAGTAQSGAAALIADAVRHIAGLEQPRSGGET